MRTAGNVKAQTDTELERMKAIVAMLLAFARLADRVSNAPHPAQIGRAHV